jgi:two-component system OmpR family sensor kinase
MTSGWRRWQSSIRGRLLSGFVVLFVLGLGASSLLTAFMVNDYVFDRAVDKLEVDAERIEDLVSTGPQTVQADQLATLFGRPLGVVGLDADGDVLFSTGASEGQEPLLVSLVDGVPDSRVVATEEDLVAERIATPGLRVALDSRRVDVASLVLVQDANVDDDAVFDFIARVAMVAAGALVVLVSLALVVLKLGLRPLARMGQAADAIASGSRDERIPVSSNHSETDVLAAALNRAFDAQSRAEGRARTFAADASHELRTPVAIVSGWLELFRQGGLEGDAVETAIERIEDEVGRIRLLVEELGLLARLDDGRPLEEEPLDLVRLADSVVEDARIIYADLDITLDAPPSVSVVGDAPRLQQVLRNLVGNAVQHTPEGTSVRLAISEDAGRISVQVADDGPGISPSELPRLFDRFWRAESSRSRDYGGSGLGLAIVQAIVRAHGGHTHVESTVGQGTTVMFSLPVDEGRRT